MANDNASFSSIQPISGPYSIHILFMSKFEQLGILIGLGGLQGGAGGSKTELGCHSNIFSLTRNDLREEGSLFLEKSSISTRMKSLKINAIS